MKFFGYNRFVDTDIFLIQYGFLRIEEQNKVQFLRINQSIFLKGRDIEGKKAKHYYR